MYAAAALHLTLSRLTVGLKIAKWGIYRSTVAEAVLQTSSRITRGFERARRHVQSIPYPKTVVDGCCCRNTYSVFRKVPKLRTYSVFGMFFSWAEAPYLAAGSGNIFASCWYNLRPSGWTLLYHIYLLAPYDNVWQRAQVDPRVPSADCSNLTKLSLRGRREVHVAR